MRRRGMMQMFLGMKMFHIGSSTSSRVWAKTGQWCCWKMRVNLKDLGMLLFGSECKNLRPPNGLRDNICPLLVKSSWVRKVPRVYWTEMEQNKYANIIHSFLGKYKALSFYKASWDQMISKLRLGCADLKPNFIANHKCTKSALSWLVEKNALILIYQKVPASLWECRVRFSRMAEWKVCSICP